MKTGKRSRSDPRRPRQVDLTKYLERVSAFPLEPIRDEAHLLKAQSVLDQLLREDLDRAGEMYLGALTCLVDAYEDEHEPAFDAAEHDVLRELMRASGLTQKGLEQKVGISQSTISAVLNQQRSLTREQVLALSKYFNVHPGAFLPSRP
jgi:HTH-type transcriptional regulator/antitoxin HigA